MWKRNLSVNKWICLFGLALLIAGMVSGCAEKREETSKTDTIVFTDALGREVTASKNPKRVATLIGSFADVWQLAGGTVCATAEDAWDDFGLELEGAANIGGAHSPNLEKLLAASPDFVIASASTSSDVEMKEALENVGITVAYFDVDCFEDYLDMLDICTDLTGRKDLYEKNGLQIQKQIEKSKKELEEKNLSEKQCTVLLLRASSTSVKAKGSEGTILGEMLNDLGMVNIADSDQSLLEDLSIESIIRQEPYHIFVVTMGDDTAVAKNNLSRMMEENPAWDTLEAVREGRMHFMERKLFNLKPNARWAEAYETLCEIF